MFSGAARFAPISGVIAVLLIVIAFIVGGSTPGVGASEAEIASFYTSQQGRQFSSVFLLVWGALFLVMFGATLFAGLRAREESPRWWSRLAMAGTVIAAVGFLVAATTAIALVDGADKRFPVRLCRR